MNEAPPPELERAVHQLRTLVVGLGVIVGVSSVSLSGFVWKITGNTAAVAKARQQQLADLQVQVKQLGAVANELGNYSAGRPDLLAIFRNHGLDFQPAPPPSR